MTDEIVKPTCPTRRAVLFACGNTFHGDDGVGWHIGCTLERQPLRDGLVVVRTRELLPEHAQTVSAADVVVFVDCSAATRAGTVSTIPVEAAESFPRSLTHPLDPASLLKLAKDLYSSIPARAVAITLGGLSFELTDQLSQEVKRAVPKALEAVRFALSEANPALPVPQHS